MAEAKQPQKTGLGMDQNVEGALCYLFGWVTGIVFLLLEKENRFVRFHAMQSIVTFAPLFIAWIVLNIILGGLISSFGGVLSFLLGGLLSILLWLVTVILWVVLMVMAFQGKEYKLPIVGPIAEAQLKKTPA